MKTELIIMTSLAGVYQSSGTIDLYNDIPISLNYSIADIKEPDKRNADYSKTITAPGTNNNNHLLSNIYEIGIDRLYNPNKKVEARILYDKIQVMKGFLRLVKIRTLRDNKIEYDFEIKGRLDDLFTNIKDKKITDLTWSDLDHTYNKTNIKNSWSAAVGSNYLYPFIDYGYSISGVNYEVSNFKPATYVKEIWDRIFQYAGFQYVSTFLTGTFFKSLTIPFNSEKMLLTEAQINLRKFRASRETTIYQIQASTPNYTAYDIILNNDSTAPNEDTGNNYNTATGTWVCPASGHYSFTASVDASKILTLTGNNIYIRVVDITNAITEIDYASATALLNAAGTPVTLTLSSPYTFISAGTNIRLQGLTKLPNPSGNYIDIGIGSYFYANANPDLGNGDTITFVNTLPQTIKISEFLLSIIKMFNLYIEYDKDTPNKMLIEPRNDFYTSTIQDWSDRLDTSREPEIMPMGALDAKRYIFRYKRDGDYLNTLYQTTYGQGTDETYGQRIKDVDNDFLKNENVMESIFSPTPLYSDTVSDRVYPLIIKVDPVTQVLSQMQTNVRILYYGGLKSCQSWNFYAVGTWPNGTGLSFESQYPYCGHLDDPAAPTIDLSFGIPKEIYYIPAWNATYTNANLYNTYWKQMIDEITDYNSSIITAWFWLTPADILEVDFRHVYHFKNQNFRLNKIYDYNPSANSLTKCEFIKMKASKNFAKSIKILSGGYATLP